MRFIIGKPGEKPREPECRVWLEESEDGCLLLMKDGVLAAALVTRDGVAAAGIQPVMNRAFPGDRAEQERCTAERVALVFEEKADSLLEGESAALSSERLPSQGRQSSRRRAQRKPMPTLRRKGRRQASQRSPGTAAPNLRGASRLPRTHSSSVDAAWTASSARP